MWNTRMSGIQRTISIVALLALGWASCNLFAREKNSKEEERLHEAGVILKEILDIPDSIPSDLINKAECVIIIPSVKKLAIGIGGSYGRGAINCRGGGPFNRPRSAAPKEGPVGAKHR